MFLSASGGFRNVVLFRLRKLWFVLRRLRRSQVYCSFENEEVGGLLFSESGGYRFVVLHETWEFVGRLQVCCRLQFE